MKYSKYPSYRDSEDKWLRTVPEHWEVKSLKSILQERKESNKPIKTKDILSLCMYRGVIPYSEKGNSGNKAKDDLTAYKLAYPNDIVLNSMNVVAGSVGLSKYFGAVSPVYYMLRPRKNEDIVEYFNGIFQSETFQKSLFGLGNGILVKESESTGKLNTIRMRIPMEKLNTVLLPYPPAVEQQNIANYLDIATAKIDTLIEKQTKLIELLREKRQAVISTAVTRGLDNTVAMKDSGVEWLGEIPEGWEALQLKRISSIKGGYAYSTSDFKDEGVQIIKIGNVYQSKFHTDRQPTYVSQEVARRTKEFLIAKGDLIISLTGTLGKRDYGYAVTVDKAGEYRLNQRVAKMQPNNKLVVTEYLSYVMKSEQYLTQIYALPSGTKQANLSNDDVLSATCALPSLVEQDKIVRHIDDKTSKIDTLITKSTKAIDLLKEKRTALISAAVTGKIDVRKNINIKGESR